MRTFAGVRGNGGELASSMMLVSTISSGGRGFRALACRLLGLEGTLKTSVLFCGDGRLTAEELAVIAVVPIGRGGADASACAGSSCEEDASEASEFRLLMARISSTVVSVSVSSGVRSGSSGANFDLSAASRGGRGTSSFMFASGRSQLPPSSCSE